MVIHTLYIIIFPDSLLSFFFGHFIVARVQGDKFKKKIPIECHKKSFQMQMVAICVAQAVQRRQDFLRTGEESLAYKEPVSMWRRLGD